MKPPAYAIEKRQRCEQLRASLWTERASFDTHWRELSQYILPRRSRFTTTDTNKGDKRNQSIIDSTATEAAGICAAGMHSGVTSPSRPWFKLGVADPDLMEMDDVKQWLHVVETRMQAAMLKSNLYKVLPIAYQDLAVFGTTAFSIVDHPTKVFWCADFPLGTYAVANDRWREVRTFVRMFRRSVGQVVEEWGNLDENGQPDFERGQPTALSQTVQDLWKRGDTVAWVDIVHVVQPNVSYDGIKSESKYKKYEEIYYEWGTNAAQHPKGDVGILSHSGYDEFPVLVGRWETSGDDVYGTNCPGMTALGDIKQLQLGEKRGAQALDKTVNPPLIGPSRLQNAKVTALPGDITYDDTRDGTAGLRPLYQVQFNIEHLGAKQEQLRQKIKSVFKVDLFLMIDQSEHVKTATEVDELKQEKLLIVGPVLEQMKGDIHDATVDRVFGIMLRKGMFPAPPESLQGTDLKVEYVSIMADAQKQTGLSALERTLSFAGQAIQVNAEAADVVDFDQLMREHVEAGGSPPKVLRSEDDVSAMRQQRAKQAQMQQAAANAPGIASALKDAGHPTDPSSPLAKILGNRNAVNTLNATQQPAA